MRSSWSLPRCAMEAGATTTRGSSACAVAPELAGASIARMQPLAAPPAAPERTLGAGASLLTVVVTFVLCQIAGTVAMVALLVVRVVQGSVPIEQLRNPATLQRLLREPWILGGATIIAG